MKYSLLGLLFVSLTSACAHYPDVRPGESGNHKVVIAGDDERKIAREGIKQARSYCDSVHKKSPTIVSEDTKYVGDMDEETYRNSKRATKAAQMIGGAGVVLGGENERNAGGVVGLGGAVGDAVIGDGYRYTMVFKCK